MKKHLTDEQRVARYVAGLRRQTRQAMPLWYIEVGCTTAHKNYGIMQAPSSWLRAFWYAVSDGMLGVVEKLPRQKGERFHRYKISATREDILRAAGADYKPIPHGNHKERG